MSQRARKLFDKVYMRAYGGKRDHPEVRKENTKALCLIFIEEMKQLRLEGTNMWLRDLDEFKQEITRL